MNKLIIKSFFYASIATILASCATTKQKIDAFVKERESTEIQNFDSSITNSVLEQKIIQNELISDKSKIKITYYSEKKDSLGNQLMDRTAEVEYNIVKETKSDINITNRLNSESISKLYLSQEKDFTIWIKEKKKKTRKSYYVIVIISVISISVIFTYIINNIKRGKIFF